ncbi:conserved Plasmodium protein, unknown function [Plasmodium relictum]|uniref:Uncharacterized protein n=1 Tax=Plasmodium relictum TaxID=85471 RepID=A0A1J1HA48_PLARL|nr:conserved Plasmodium protein, unknown function [Plasmodium relictum]CRH01502.1 conserved Plasmodium protein, unknown function [Plasmodium relictum]
MHKCVNLDSFNNELKSNILPMNENLNQSSVIKNNCEIKVERKIQNIEKNSLNHNDTDINKLNDKFLYLCNNIVRNNTKKNCINKILDDNLKNYNYNVFSEYVNKNKPINSQKKLDDINIAKLNKENKFLTNERISTLINNDSKTYNSIIINMNNQNSNLTENSNKILENVNYNFDSLNKKSNGKNKLDINNTILINNADKDNYSKEYFFYENDNLKERNFDNNEERNNINLKENYYNSININNDESIKKKIYLDIDEKKGKKNLIKNYEINNEKENINRNNIYNIFINSCVNKNSNANIGILNFLKNKKKYNYSYDNKGIRNDIKENENSLIYKNIPSNPNDTSSLLKGSTEDNEEIKSKISIVSNLNEHHYMKENDLKKKELINNFNLNSFEELKFIKYENDDIKNSCRKKLNDNLKKKENESNSHKRVISTRINQNNPFSLYHYVKKEHMSTNNVPTKNIPLNQVNDKLSEYSKKNISYNDINKIMSIISEKSNFNKKNLDIFTTLSEIHSIHSSNYNNYSKKSLKSEMSKQKEHDIRNISNEHCKNGEATDDENLINKQNNKNINSLYKEEKKQEKVKKKEDLSYKCISSYSSPSSTNSTICSSLSKKKTKRNKTKKEIEEKNKMKNIKYKKNNTKLKSDIKNKQEKDHFNMNKSSNDYIVDNRNSNYNITRNYNNDNNNNSNNNDNNKSINTTTNNSFNSNKKNDNNLPDCISNIYCKNKMQNNNRNSYNNSVSNFYTNSNFSNDNYYYGNNSLKNSNHYNIERNSCRNDNNNNNNNVENSNCGSGKHSNFNKLSSTIDNSSSKDIISNNKNRKKTDLAKSKIKYENNKNIVEKKIKNEELLNDKHTILKIKNNAKVKTKNYDSCKNNKKTDYISVVDEFTFKKEKKIDKNDNNDNKKNINIERNIHQNKSCKNNYKTNKNGANYVNSEYYSDDKTVNNGIIFSRNSSVSTSNNSSKYINSNTNSDININRNNGNLNNKVSSHVKEKLKNKNKDLCDPIKNECKIPSIDENCLKNNNIVGEMNIQSNTNNINEIKNDDNENEIINYNYDNLKKSARGLNNSIKKKSTKNENKNKMKVENIEKLNLNNKKIINSSKNNNNNNNNEVTKDKNSSFNNPSNTMNIKDNCHDKYLKKTNNHKENKEKYTNFIGGENLCTTKNKEIYMISSKKLKEKKILKSNVDINNSDNLTNYDYSLSRSNNSANTNILKKNIEQSCKIKKEVNVSKSKYNNLQKNSKKDSDKAIDTDIKYIRSRDNIKNDISNDFKEKSFTYKKIEYNNNHKMIINEIKTNNYTEILKDEVDKRHFLYLDGEKKSPLNKREENDTLVNMKRNEKIIKQKQKVITNSTINLDKNFENTNIRNSSSVNNIKLNETINTRENCKNSKNFENCKHCKKKEKDNDYISDDDISYKNTYEKESLIDFNDNLLNKRNNISDTITSCKSESNNGNLNINNKNDESLNSHVKLCIDQDLKNQNKFIEIINLKKSDEKDINNNTKKDVSNIEKNNTLNKKEKEILNIEKNKIPSKLEASSNEKLYNLESIKNIKSEIDKKNSVYKNNFYEKEKQQNEVMNYEKRENLKIDLHDLQQKNSSYNNNKNPFYLFINKKNKNINSFAKNDQHFSKINKTELKEHNTFDNSLYNKIKTDSNNDINKNGSHSMIYQSDFNNTQNSIFSNNDNFEKKGNDKENINSVKDDIILNCNLNNDKEQRINKSIIFNSTIMNDMKVKKNLEENKNISLRYNILNENKQNIELFSCDKKSQFKNKKEINIYHNNLDDNDNKKKKDMNNLIFFHEFDSSNFLKEILLENKENSNNMNNIIKKEQEINFNNFSLDFENIIKNYKEKSENYLNKRYMNDLNRIYFLVEKFIDTYSCDENLKSIFQLLKSELEKIKKESLYFCKDQNFLIIPIIDVKKSNNNLNKIEKEYIKENETDEFISKSDNYTLESCENEPKQGNSCLRKNKVEYNFKSNNNENNNINNNDNNNYYLKEYVNRKYRRINYLTSLSYNNRLNNSRTNSNKCTMQHIKIINKNKSCLKSLYIKKKRINSFNKKFLCKKNIFIIRNSNYIHKFKISNHFFLKNKHLYNKKNEKLFKTHFFYNKEIFFKKKNCKRENVLNDEIISCRNSANYNIEDLFISDDEVNLIYTYNNHLNEKVYSLEKINVIKNENSNSSTFN